MEQSFKKIQQGYKEFRTKYALGDNSVMRYLSHYGQNTQIMVMACCDSRVDPALILQCDPGDLFVVRNVANIVPPYENSDKYIDTSAALEFGTCILKVKHLILLGHSQCNGIKVLLEAPSAQENDFISNWVSLVRHNSNCQDNQDLYAKSALQHSYENCMTFPWIKNKVLARELMIHKWFFDIQTGQIFTCSDKDGGYTLLEC